MKASIIIAGYNSAEHYFECLTSLFQQGRQDLEVIWVDSDSQDGSANRIAAEFPDVKLVRLNFNAGFRRGTNIGAREARGEFLIPCNQDTRVAPGWIDALLSAAEETPSAAIVAPKILLWDSPDQINEAGNLLHFSGLYGSRGLGMRSADFSQREVLATMSGCCFLIRKDIWNTLGGFSEDFDQFETGWHASFEDLDLAWRAQLLGYQVIFAPEAIMFHKYERKGMTPERFLTFEWGRLLVVVRNYQSLTLLLIAPALFGLELAAWGFAVARGGPWIRNKWKLLLWTLRHPGTLLKMRKRVQKSRRVRDSVILRRMSPTIEVSHVLPGRRIGPMIQSFIDTFSPAYHRLILWLTQSGSVSEGSVETAK